MPNTYFYYADIFVLDLIMELFKNASIIKHGIKQMSGKLSVYEPLYALSPVELQTLKAYIETHLKVRFIRFS